MQMLAAQEFVDLLEMGHLVGVDIDAHIRDLIIEALADKGWSQRELCRRTRTVHPAALSSFLSGRTKSMDWEKYAEMQIALGVKLIPDPQDGSTSSLPQAGQQPPNPVHSGVPYLAVRPIPVIELSRLPMGGSTEQRSHQIRAIAREWIMVLVSDPDAFGVLADAPIWQAAAGDILIASPATPGQRGNYILEVSGDRPRFAQLVEVSAGVLVAQANGELIPQWKSAGTIRGQWRNWL